MGMMQQHIMMAQMGTLSGIAPNSLEENGDAASVVAEPGLEEDGMHSCPGPEEGAARSRMAICMEGGLHYGAGGAEEDVQHAVLGEGMEGGLVDIATGAADV